MSLIYYLKRLYSLDTLDTRFTTTTTQQTPQNKTTGETAIAENANRRRSQHVAALPEAKPSLWRTPEYFFYYFVFLTVVPFMFKVPYDVSKSTDPQYPKFEPLLSPGWIPGRKVDNSDGQYASFRDNIPYMAIVVVVHPLLRKIFNYLYPIRASKADKTEVYADARLKQRVSYDLGFAVIFCLVLHGFSAFKVFFILYCNYQLATGMPRKYIPVATWVFNIGVLFANELGKGYPYASIARLLTPAPSIPGSASPQNWGSWLDSYGGLIPRWEVLFNITILRLISFNLDYYWSLEHRGGSPVEKQLDPSALSERDRVAIPAPPSTYNLNHYLAYALYSPLYLAGPILTFNDYISQCRHRLSSITPARTALYAVRFLLTLLAMELILHHIYAVAISKSAPTWSAYTPFQLSMLAYFNLQIIWLKLLLPWRFFRLWALLDAVDPPENMVRCMSNNYSVNGFWRGWHRSLNRWIVRYVYVPIQRQPRAALRFAALPTVFTFIALWHDISLRLLTWSWLIVLFFLPELVATLALHRFAPGLPAARPTRYRLLCGIGAVGNILMLMTANLVGFALGLDGLEGLVAGIVDSWQGWAFVAAACGALFVGVMVMFEVRETERRKGIVLKC